MRSTAETTGGSSSAYRGPASSRPAVSKTLTGPHPSHSTDEWLGLFDGPILGNSALDRLANASYQIVIEGASYRERLSPHRALLDRKEVVDPQTSR